MPIAYKSLLTTNVRMEDGDISSLAIHMLSLSTNSLRQQSQSALKMDESLVRSIRENKARTLDLPRFFPWTMAICIVNFDLDLGQSMLSIFL